jgi:dihydropyrimidine dehydrogenase (NAD+) subunit PreA
MIKTADLRIEFCGVVCENPFFLSSSCIAADYEMCARALQLGWGGVVFKTIGFYQPQEVSPRFDSTEKEGAVFVGFRNMEQISDHPLAENLSALKKLKQDFPQKVIVASIMGETEEEWTKLARLCEEVAVDLIECNFSCPQMAKEAMGADVGVDPDLVKSFCQAVRRGTSLPILSKMTPNITDMTVPARAALEGGADGIAAINTVKSITGLNTAGRIQPNIAGYSSISGYSGKAIKPIALRFISELAACSSLKGASLSGIGGIETWQDALEFIALGSQNVQITTAVMQYGYRIIDDLKEGLSEYMKEQRIEHLADIVGMALPQLKSSEALDRQSVLYPLFDERLCVGCGRCYISCRDAGHQAVLWEQTKRRPVLVEKNCVGCHLCRLVCPTKAIGLGERKAKNKSEDILKHIK